MKKELGLVEAKEWQLDQLPYEIMWFNEEGKIVYMNMILAKKLGYSAKEQESLSIFDLNPGTNKASWESHWEEVKTKKFVNFKTMHKKKDGFIYEVEVFARFFSNMRNGDLIFATVNEITNSSFYKNVLNKTEELVKAGGWKLNLQDQSLIVTDEVLSIFKVSSKEMIRPNQLVRYFKEPEKFQKIISRALTKGEDFDEILEIKDDSGEEKWIRCAGQPILYQDKITKLMGIYQDVSEFQRNLQSNRLYKEIINQSEDIVFVWNETGDLVDFSDSAIDQLGFERNEFEGIRIYDLDEEIDQNWWEKHFQDIKERNHFIMEWKATRKNGEQFPVEISVNHIVFRGQSLNCAILRDISGRKRQEADLKKAFSEIQALKDQLEKENRYLQEESRTVKNFENIICVSKSYAEVLKQVQQVGPTDTTVLITGESGTGKELLADAIHQNSKRKNNVMVKVNCATIPKELFESELFGHTKGSFTGAVKDKDGKFTIAKGGTIFLDEVGEIPLELQAKLLRVLQEGEFDVVGGNTQKVDVRIIAATNRDLEKMIEEGQFREDLFYRLNVFPIHNIALRERKEDIIPLSDHFLNKFSSKVGKTFNRLSKKTVKLLLEYPFPGNIRELEHLIERAVILEEGPTLNPGSWMPKQRESNGLTNDLISFERMQKEYIIKVLRKTNGKVSGVGGAAEILKMNNKTLFAKMKKLGIEKKVV